MITRAEYERLHAEMTNALRRGLLHAARASQGDNAAVNTNLAQRSFAVVGAIGGYINATLNLTRALRDGTVAGGKES